MRGPMPQLLPAPLPVWPSAVQIPPQLKLSPPYCVILWKHQRLSFRSFERHESVWLRYSTMFKCASPSLGSKILSSTLTKLLAMRLDHSCEHLKVHSLPHTPWHMYSTDPFADRHHKWGQNGSEIGTTENYSIFALALTTQVHMSN